jgi:hypothetical protein
MKTIEEKNHPIHAAGRLWTVPTISLTELPDGTLAVAQAELARVHRGIANAICGSPGQLSQDDLEFLCDVSDTTFAQVANQLRVDKSTISKWRSRGADVPLIYSLYLKKFFWFLHFGQALGSHTIELGVAGDEAEFLSAAKEKAIEHRLAIRVHERRADAA